MRLSRSNFSIFWTLQLFSNWNIFNEGIFERKKKLLIYIVWIVFSNSLRLIQTGHEPTSFIYKRHPSGFEALLLPAELWNSMSYSLPLVSHLLPYVEIMPMTNTFWALRIRQELRVFHILALNLTVHSMIHVLLLSQLYP